MNSDDLALEQARTGGTTLRSNAASERSRDDGETAGTQMRTQHDDYRYKHVSTKVFMEDMYFRDGAPVPGDRLPSIDLPTVDGGRVRSSEFIGSKPLLLITGSSTCPMTASSDPLLTQLHAEFGDKVEFVMLHVREAHPGERKLQPDSYGEKTEHARELKKRDKLPFTIAIDDPSGTTHRMLDEKPNAIWLADRQGNIAYRALFAGDEKGLRQALSAVINGNTPEESESRRRLVPMAMGIGMMQEMVRRSGPRAQADIIKAAPPMAAMAWIADRFRPLDSKWRGLAAMATMAGVLVGITSIARRQIRSSKPT